MVIVEEEWRKGRTRTEGVEEYRKVGVAGRTLEVEESTGGRKRTNEMEERRKRQEYKKG